MVNASNIPKRFESMVAHRRNSIENKGYSNDYEQKLA
jgi:hypothetical protein